MTVATAAGSTVVVVLGSGSNHNNNNYGHAVHKVSVIRQSMILNKENFSLVSVIQKCSEVYSLCVMVKRDAFLRGKSSQHCEQPSLL
jgi:hypothetical protein